jgi:hypothetical protein
MRIELRVNGLLAIAMAASAFLAGVVAAAPDTYHDIGSPTTVQAVGYPAAHTAITASSPDPDTYHDI